MAKIIETKEINQLANEEGQAKCPIVKPQNMIGGKWKLILLWLISLETRRFNELQRLLPDISKGILSKNLRELESDCLIHREIYKEVPPKVEYSLTEIGKSFVPILNGIAEWGKQYEATINKTITKEINRESVSNI